LPHFRIDAKPSAGNELQTEYFVARNDATAAIYALQQVSNQFAPHLMVGEIRTIAADNFWLSPCYRQDCVAFHFTWKQDWNSVRGVLPTIEAQLAPFNACPHWGKLFTVPPQRVQALYAKMPQFKQLIAQHDPDGKFRNEFLDTNLFAN
jgi:xylitol oxidase